MRHVTIASFVGKLPVKLGGAVRAVVFAIMLWTLYIIMRELLPIMEIEARSTTVALPIDLPRSYFFSLPLLISCALMVPTLLLFLFEAILRAFGATEDDLLAPIMGSQQ
jgi:TRAP-type C4-dicarboxylate transport system permease small subunit